ncbi:transcription antitermination factor NusB [Adlercreutzia equolifaciens]|uniref:transcription antitermination factor NusB n=1 Tax=Adlercreutzia equolifaciens TaxID=446660 RepID=UPI0023B2053B|nr:transcription antitermination factor NusB [Adlercreutzia equolifaciens]MDE8703256.1 transcription antitermination factor NusB [Adlercreutzia equolifaciens]
MRNDHRAHNQRRSYDRASQGDRLAQGGRPSQGGKPRGDRRFDRRGGKPGAGKFRRDDDGKGGKPDFRKRDGARSSERSDRSSADKPYAKRDGKPGGFKSRDGKPGGFKPRDGKPGGFKSQGDRRDGFKPREDRAEGFKPRPAGQRDDFKPRREGDGPRAPRTDGAQAVQKRKGSGKHATSARELALSAIHQLRERDAFAQDIIAKTIDTSKLSREDRAFATRLVLGVVSMRGTLDEILDSCMDSPDDVSPAVRDALDLSVYEIIFLDKSPHAAVDQGVELVRSVAPRASGLANAVLRRVVRAKDAFPFGDPRKDLAAYARLHGFPQWLTERLLKELGPQNALAFMKASNEPAPVFVAINAAKADEAEVVSVLAAAHGEPEAVTVAGRPVPGCYRLCSGVVLHDGRVRRMFNQGLILVSDATSQAIANLVLEGEKPATFLEIGAGRATKTILDQSCAVRRFGSQIDDYVTVDNHAFKTKLLRERCEQYGINVADALTGDATDLDVLIGERTFDTVFVDSPCSGLGTLRRHPEIRWRLTAEAIEEQAALDEQLLAAAAGHVAPGGLLAYATCTITQQENAAVVERFLASEAGAAFEVVPYDNPELGVEAPFFSTMLEPGSSDAHFLARMRRKAE